MRTTIALLLVGLCAFALAEYKFDQYGNKYKVADKVFLEKQKDVLRLFKYIFQSNYYKDQHEIAVTYDIVKDIESYHEPKYVKEFHQYFKKGFLPRGEVFSVFYEAHREQAIALFNVLYFAKDWETFYKTACWAREHVNEGMFVYAMHLAVLHRHDCEGMVLPPIYEVYPHFFVNSQVIDKAYEYKMKYGGVFKDEKTFYIPANYSGLYTNANPIQHDLSYFTDDVGLNAYYYYYHLDYPFWMGGKEFNLHQDRRGELFYFVHQQILARYYLERLSNGYGAVPVFDWDKEIKSGYVPSMRYPNGLSFPVRPAHSELSWNPHNQPFTFTGEDNVFQIMEIEDYERRIRDAIDFGFVYTEDGKKINLYEKGGFDLLGKIVESSPDSPNTRFYGDLQVIARQVLGYSYHPVHEYQVAPSALEHFETALRDPVFYQFYKRITYYFLKYKSHLPTYTYSELFFSGVKIEEVHIDKLVTFYDDFVFDLTNTFYVTEEEFEKDNFYVWAHQYRLNHKPFAYRITVQSDKETDVVVRVFIGPKYDEFGHNVTLNDNRVNFFEMDKFVYHLKTGKNVIEHNSRKAETVKDRTTFRTLYKKVESALKGQGEFHLDMSEAHNGFPDRFVLPKGSVNGQEFQMFFFISPYTQKHTKYTFDPVYSAGVGSGMRYYDEKPFGYPFDRQIEDEEHFFVPNSHMEDVIVYHQEDKEVRYGHFHGHHHKQPKYEYDVTHGHKY